MKRLLLIALITMASLSAYSKPTTPDTLREHQFSAVWQAITDHDPAASQMMGDFQSRYGLSSDFLTLESLLYSENGDEQTSMAKLDEALAKVTKQDLFDRATIFLFKAMRVDNISEQLIYAGEAIKADPKYAKAYAFRARVYFEIFTNSGFMINEVESDLKKAIKLVPNELSYRSLLTRFYMLNDQDAKAAKEIKAMLKIDVNFEDAYFFRSILMKQQGNIEKYIDDYLIYLQLSHDTDLELMQDIAEEGSYYDYLMDFAGKILKGADSRENSAYWNYFVGMMKSSAGDATCIDNYTAGLSVADDEDIYCRLLLAQCSHYSQTENYDSALISVDKALDIIERDGLAAFWIYQNRAYYLKSLKRFAEADSAYTRCLSCVINDSSSHAEVLYYRAELRFSHLHDSLGALSDLDSALALSSDYRPALYTRGRLLKMQGRTDLASVDFNHILDLDTSVVFFSYRHMALAQMGRRTEAEQWLELIQTAIDSDMAKMYVTYNAACMYSILGDVNMAVKYLMDAMALSPIDCDQISENPDFDNIRNTPEFVSLLKITCSE